MKGLKYVLIIFIGFPILSNGQVELPIDESGNVVYTEVVALQGKTKKQLYDKAKLWMVSTLKSGDNMVELGGDNSDQIIGTGNISLEDIKPPVNRNAQLISVYLNFKFIVFCKEERFKYELSNITLSYISRDIPLMTDTPVVTNLVELKYPSYIKNKQKIGEFQSQTKNMAHQDLKALIRDFVNTMTSEDEDW